jgi:hypothetical protein
LAAGDIRRVRSGSDHDEIVPGDLSAVDTVGSRDEFLLVKLRS